MLIDKNFKSWSKFRKLGKSKYTVLWIIYFVFLINMFIGIGRLMEGKIMFNIQNIIIDTIIGIIGGIIIGKFSWNSSEVKYQKYINENRK
ncbi:hypothetical protein [Clostridium sp. 'White wine YQ']|uniref:hypothetical protein n=1 Tax=Clostridium sp. 'White wine YQ' TaxID=3027474 RepID=UPI002365839D|nr:hypothetical protein [Clostridium sp. 'White wine YQ']MDD7793894.1 hypothetical protein [Clostridium sp. 'White wine YQ']